MLVLCYYLKTPVWTHISLHHLSLQSKHGNQHRRNPSIQNYMAPPWWLLSFPSLVPFQEQRMAAATQCILANLSMSPLSRSYQCGNICTSTINCNNIIYVVVGRKIKLQVRNAHGIVYSLPQSRTRLEGSGIAL